MARDEHHTSECRIKKYDGNFNWFQVTFIDFLSYARIISIFMLIVMIYSRESAISEWFFDLNLQVTNTKLSNKRSVCVSMDIERRKQYELKEWALSMISL